MPPLTSRLPAILGSTKCLPPILLILTCIKILLIPTYRSTDFDVHRNWLAITHNLPLEEWYFNDVNGTTVHTLDYPPAFAFFEYVLANNPLSQFMMPANDRCFQLLPDSDNDPSDACIMLQRSSVILSDVVLWMGAWVACRAMYPTRLDHSISAFLLIVLNPGLLWLDHVHFQYNGMLLGILLLSLGLLMHGNNVAVQSTSYHFYHLTGAASYALLVNCKHLYLTLGPLYFCYLLEQYCFTRTPPKRFQIQNFAGLGVVTLTSLIIPWIPFLLLQDPKEQMVQILARLFPFQRGLVHDYWAANVWALYMLADKGVGFLSKLNVGLALPSSSLPQVPPSWCAGLLLASMISALFMTRLRCWTNVKLIQAVVYMSLAAFMLAYHVHEKAILTTLIPLTLLVHHENATHSFLFTQIARWGLLGLFPLLFRPMELTLKLASYACYWSLSSYLVPQSSHKWLQTGTGIVVAGVIVVLEFLPIPGRFEFLPLLLTSIMCALGLVGCWLLSFWLLVQK
jgi:alpha-1,3-glucosyltransferase